MNQHDESALLLNGVKQRFEQRKQVQHYRKEAAEGLTPAEAWLLQPLRAGERVLDVGCGAGRVVRQVALAGCAVTGVDVSLPLLRAARAHNGDAAVDYLQTEPLRLSFRHATFSSILAIKVYCYIPTRAARLAYLVELERMLVPNGLIYISQQVIPAEQWDEASKNIAETNAQYAQNYTSLEAGDTFTSGPDGGTYLHWFTPQALRDELEEAGLHLDLFELDTVVGGEGYLALARLRNA